MPSIAQLLGINTQGIQANVVTGNILADKLGFEVELEGGNGDWPEVQGWELKRDGSLRDGMEYVFNGPRGGDVAKTRIAAFVAAMAAYGPEPTSRCSTHLHMDVREVTWDVYEKIVLAYMVYEDLFFDHCEPYRRNSNFCIPFMNNDWLSAAFGRRVMAAQDDHHRWHALARWSKYSALNLQVTTNFGSVEFRGSHAMTTTEELEGLALRMQSLKKIASEAAGEDNVAFVTRLSETRPQDLFLIGAIAGDYVMDAGGLAQGLSSALNAIAQKDLAGDREALREIEMREHRAAVERQEAEQRQRQQRDSVARILRREQRYNLQQLRAFNIQDPLYGNNLSGVINTAMALHAMGIPASLSNISNANADVIRWVRNNRDTIRDVYGYEIPGAIVA